MVATPCAFALSSTALPVPESRFTMTRTFTPLVSIWSAIVWKAFLSPCAFWMSYLTPASLNACSRYGRSLPSQRAEVLLSGRMTPTKGCLELPELPLELPHAASPLSAIAPAAVTARIPFRMRGSFRGTPHDGGGTGYRILGLD